MSRTSQQVMYLTFFRFWKVGSVEHLNSVPATEKVSMVYFSLKIRVFVEVNVF